MAGPQRKGSRGLVRVGFVLAALSLVLTALPALIIGILVVTRGRGRAGAAIILMSLLLPLTTFGFLKLVLHARAFRAPSESMAPTIKIGERFVTTGDDDPKRGDVVVYHAPAGAVTSRCGVPHPRASACPRPTRGRSGVYFIKRVVALPGERLHIAGGHAVVNGRRLAEPYARVGERCQTCDLPRDITIPADHYFTMGDNRAASQDSRELGPVSGDSIVGKARLRYWPLSRFGSPG